MDFAAFAEVQEQLISSNSSFDYVEGFVMINRTGLLNNWRSSFNCKDPVQASRFFSEGKTLFCLEIAKYFNEGDAETTDQVNLKKIKKKGKVCIHPTIQTLPPCGIYWVRFGFGFVCGIKRWQ